jgi:D-arabinono-1,4-lactone oxidase
MMIELIELSRCDGGYELIAAYEKELAKLGGRSHWGQVNTLTASDGLLETMYPRYPDWLRVLGKLNASGVFDSPFTERVGISAPRFTP